MKLSKSKYLKFFPITKNGQFLLSCATKEEKGKKKIKNWKFGTQIKNQCDKV